MRGLGGRLVIAFSAFLSASLSFPAQADAPAAAPASTSDTRSDLEEGFAGALRGCGEWILHPTSWTEGTGPFLAAVGLGGKMGAVDKVDEASLPPPSLRQANHYWRINATRGAGYVLVVSDRLPICHITGGGDTDLQPVVEAVLASPDFANDWERVGDRPGDEMASTTFRSREDRGLSITISRSRQPRQRLDRVQVIATATYRING